MIHFFSVHICPFWVDIQKRFLVKNVSKFKIYASLKEDMQDEYKDAFDGWQVIRKPVGINQEPNHRGRLLLLVDKFIINIENSDLVCLIDSDAFPITSEFEEFVNCNLLKNSFIAAQRLDMPSISGKLGTETVPWIGFICMKAGFYKKNINHIRKKFGTNFSAIQKYWDGRIAEIRKMKWLKLRRTNVLNLSPAMFSIYGNLIYHHGAGSRIPGRKLTHTISLKKLLSISDIVKREIVDYDDFYIRLGLISVDF